MILKQLELILKDAEAQRKHCKLFQVYPLWNQGMLLDSGF